MKLLTIFLFTLMLFCPIFSTGQKTQLTSKTLRIVKAIKKENTFETTIFASEATSRQLKNAAILKKSASVPELIILTQNNNPVVAAYAFEILSDTADTILYQLILQHRNDNRTFKYRRYGNEWIHGSYGTMNLNNHLFHLDGLSENERTALDSFIICEKIKSRYTAYLLEEIAPNTSLYKGIKDLAKDKFPGSTIALAKFQKEEDIDLIIKNIEAYWKQKTHSYVISTTDALIYFKHERFRNFIEENTETEPSLAQVVAVYQDSFAYNIINSNLDQFDGNMYLKKSSVKSIYKSIWQNHTPIYDSLLLKMWDRYAIINDSLFAYLSSNYPEKSLALSQKSINNIKEIDDRTLVSIDMLNFILDQDSTLAEEILIDNILNVKVSYFQKFTEFGKKIDSPQVVNALLKRFDNESNGHITVSVAKCILSYQNEEYNQLLLQAIEKNTALNDWALKDINHLLTSYNIAH
ncbi:hypothetical protein K6119_14640 [Paracrocinitomix mangrovi]|uniref:hypothetical protein n=1 Tax=Paracrocinitomix mangrovi TaxID=2862509 RepID=UPI001C8EEEED|nr:hypothetical protein [Paracrocinitomix mangrovi]UKN00970.1 hypothetical protein K6119_14640 [Paracrocinitomix mangrovi]